MRVRFSFSIAAFVTALAVLAPAPAALAQPSNNQCDLPGESPDVIVGDLSGTARYGNIGGITAYAIGTTSCNIGTCWLNWFSTTPEHPVIGQNLFRLKDGRFEQIGQSWLKHAFTALQGSVCSSSCMAASGTHLGVNCSDPYGPGLNADQSRLGPKFEVNAFTGEYLYPFTNMGQTGDALYKRLQVHDVDLDPALNPGALYFIEGQYVTHDDATSGNGTNNASYRQVTVSLTGGAFNLSFPAGATTQRRMAAISAWKTLDPGVTETLAPAPGDGQFIISAKATPLGGGVYHYEYAVHNLNSHRSAQSFSVPMPPGTLVTNMGFHDVDYHSGEPFVGTDWSPTLSSTAVAWSCESFDQNPNANALRWGTLYNFRFDANVAPGTANVTIGLFRSGFVGAVNVNTVTPNLCNANGVCDPGETCVNCAADCFHQGGGQGCCGNTSCDAGENPCLCRVDCGQQSATEVSCGDGRDNDCDGETDCVDSECCTTVACAPSDGDGDHFAAPCDCNDGNGAVYPGAPQLCDGVNDDCSDPAWPAVPAGEQDDDGDGVRVCAGDCDDASALRYPGNAEMCDGLDNDCAGGVPENEADADGDGVRVCANDCDDANPLVWSTPGEAYGLALTHDPAAGVTALQWSPPQDPGGTSVRYDTIRSAFANDFVNGAVCLESNGADTSSVDPDLPAPGSVSFYVVRAENDCPAGEGSPGSAPGAARSCP